MTTALQRPVACACGWSDGSALVEIDRAVASHGMDRTDGVVYIGDEGLVRTSCGRCDAELDPETVEARS